MNESDLLEPIKIFKKLNEEHHNNVVSYFDDLTNRSGVDIEENRTTCKKIHELEKELQNSKSDSSKLSGLLFLFIFLIIIGVIGALAGTVFVVNSQYLGIIGIVLGLILFVLGILLIVKIYSPKKRALNELINKIKYQIEELINEARRQMAPLNSLFDSSVPAKLFEKTCPLIQMDRFFDAKKYALMKEKYEMWDNSEVDSSTLDLQSGSILGNPFVVFKDLSMKMVPHTYTGTRTVTYFEGSGNNRHLETEVLRATVIKDAPNYSDQTYLVYGNEACQKLSFSRDPSNINSMNEKEIQKYVEKHEKDLDKMASKQLKTGGGYTPIGNPEFELFFGGLNRDNEVEFRMLFTALGQKNTMDLLKSDIGYGDDFTFNKLKGLNVIIARHCQGDVLFTSAEKFKGYEYDSVKEYFIYFNENYFKALFFNFAPLLSLPLYQQTKTHEYIYKDVIKSNYSPFTHECVANKYDISKFAHKDTKTDTILKTDFISKDKNVDIVNVTAHSFDTIERVTYVSERAGNGCYYDVPVKWIEYIPLEKVTPIKIEDAGEVDQGKFNSLGENDVICVNGLLSNLNDCINVDIKKIKDLMKKD